MSTGIYNLLLIQGVHLKLGPNYKQKNMQILENLDNSE